ncbi:hypothetical protein [Pseudomonas citronellolis]|nr:hypothetical protein [Pseudomonas citronellolis]MDF3933514.1 hypothetical protein [Pseudomonas citronellolis]
MRNTLLIAAGVVVVGLAIVGAAISVPLFPSFAAMQWGCSF